jgi:putative phosphoesterase
MMIGIMSDTHGDVRRTQKAIAAMKAHHPEHIIHCGDLGSHAVVAELAAGFMAPEIPVTCVYGNVDGWDDDVISSWSHVRIEGRFTRLVIAGKAIAVVHGDDGHRLRSAINGGTFDYVFTGHTHVRSDEREGRTRVINPGALHRTREPSCAVLDLETDTLRFIEIE